MSANKLGYNILADGYSLQFVDDIKAAQAPYHLVMTVPANGVDGAQDIATFDSWAEKLAPAKIVRRTYSRLEGDWSLYRSPKEQVALWKSQNRPQYIHEAPSNEPSLWRDPEINRRFVANQVELMDRAADVGITVAAGVFSVGLPYEGYIKDGIYDNFIRAVNRGKHYISAHLYGTGMIDLGEVIGYGAGIDPTIADIRNFRWPFGVEHNYWLLRRPDYFAHRAIAIGEAIPPVLATEGVIDLIPDALSVLNAIDRKYKMQKYNYDLRGILSWKEYYKAAYPDLTLSQVAAKMAEHILNNVLWPDFYKGIMLFAVNNLWDTPQGSNYGNAELNDFRKIYLPAMARSVPVFPDKNNAALWEKGTLTLTGGVKNIRSFPANGQMGADIGDINAGVYTNVQRSKETWKGGVYNWRAYQVEGFVDFYLADEVVATWEALVADPLLVLDFGKGTITGTKEDFQRLKAMIAIMLSEIEDLTIL